MKRWLTEANIVFSVMYLCSVLCCAIFLIEWFLLQEDRDLQYDCVLQLVGCMLHKGKLVLTRLVLFLSLNNYCQSLHQVSWRSLQIFYLLYTIHRCIILLSDACYIWHFFIGMYLLLSINVMFMQTTIFFVLRVSS